MTDLGKTKEMPVSITDAIYNRHVIRSYLADEVEPAIIHKLLNAAVHAPTAMHQEPWSFAVIQDLNMLKSLSDYAKELVRKEVQGPQAQRMLDLINQDGYNVFYNAGTLLVIYTKHKGHFVAADCWLAAENLMLAAYELGLGSCVIGFAVSALNSEEWKAKLGIPAEMEAIAPIIVGYRAGGDVPVTSRKEPEIVAWFKNDQFLLPTSPAPHDVLKC